MTKPNHSLGSTVALIRTATKSDTVIPPRAVYGGVTQHTPVSLASRTLRTTEHVSKPSSTITRAAHARRALRWAVSASGDWHQRGTVSPGGTGGHGGVLQRGTHVEGRGLGVAK